MAPSIFSEWWAMVGNSGATTPTPTPCCPLYIRFGLVQYPILHTPLFLSPKGHKGWCAIDVPFLSCLLPNNLQQTIRYVTLVMWPLSTPQTYVVIGFVEELYHPISKPQITRSIFLIKSQKWS